MLTDANRISALDEDQAFVIFLNFLEMFIKFISIYSTISLMFICVKLVYMCFFTLNKSIYILISLYYTYFRTICQINLKHKKSVHLINFWSGLQLNCKRSWFAVLIPSKNRNNSVKSRLIIKIPVCILDAFCIDLMDLKRKFERKTSTRVYQKISG